MEKEKRTSESTLNQKQENNTDSFYHKNSYYHPYAYSKSNPTVQINFSPQCCDQSKALEVNINEL
jgi:hypothetical protein